jgi:ketosteroid isomerase-like protein
MTKRQETDVMPDSGDPMATVRQYIEAFNNGDESAMAAACTDPMQILDGMSPHVWQGPTAAQDWWKDVLAEGEHLGASGYRITLGEPRHVDVNGESAYVVAPATMTFDLRGKQVTQTGSVYTVVRVIGCAVSATEKGQLGRNLAMNFVLQPPELNSARIYAGAALSATAAPITC